jgi:FkbM family methyltransferase
MQILVQANSASFVGRLRHGIATSGVSSLPGKAARLLRRSWRQFMFKPYIITKHVAGETFSFQIADVWAEDWYAIGEAENEETLWLRAQLRPGDLFVDCGAHHGLFTLLASHWVGDSGKVIAIEALKENAHVIRRNIAMNEITNASVENIAISDTTGVGHVEYRKFGFLNNSNGVVRDSPSKDTTEVRTTTIDDVLRGRKPSVLKIDIEGYEVAGLAGAQQALDALPVLDIEVHCNCWQDAQSQVRKLFALISMQKYYGHIQLDVHGELVPLDVTKHTPELIAQYDNVHLFLVPIQRMS